MIIERYDNLKEGHEVRQNLIALRKELQEKGEKQQWIRLQQEEGDVLTDCLYHQDPKVRKNAALILGELGEQKSLQPLFEAYKKEERRFVKTAYLKGISHLDYQPIEQQLEERLKQLVGIQPSEEEKKHIQEEMHQIQDMLHQIGRKEKHVFCGYNNSFEMLLTTYTPYQQITADQARQIEQTQVQIVPAGVLVRTRYLQSVQQIRTYRELLFLLKGKKSLTGTPEEIGAALAETKLLEQLEKNHKQKVPFYFRLEIRSKMTLGERSVFAKRLSAALEANTQRKLLNSTSDYEVELRLIENREGGFLPCFRLMTLPDARFAYRKEVVATSIHPSLAALCMQLAEPYLKEHAQILDPFCGVGTMLVERNRVLRARVNYGIDLFGEAIEKARHNTKRAGITVHYINRNFFEFKHEYLFDEIVTNMPVRGKSTKEEMDQLYASFFEKAREVLKVQGIVILYSCETGFVKKQLRLHPEFRLKTEFELRKKDDAHLFIIEKK